MKVSLACLGSRAAAVQPNSLWNILQNVFQCFTNCRPRVYKIVMKVSVLQVVPYALS